MNISEVSHSRYQEPSGMQCRSRDCWASGGSGLTVCVRGVYVRIACETYTDFVNSTLGILQDSPKDWNTHAPHMASVYGQSYLTISADAAEHSDAGFLHGENRHRFASSSVPFNHHGQTGSVLVRERGALAYELPFHDWTRPISQSHAPLQISRVPENLRRYFNQDTNPPQSALSKRGWAFQERILAPRTLYFGKGETGWECHGSMTCECSANSPRFRRREMHLLKTKFLEAPWELIIQKYTQLDLTMATDRLIALSGLAAAHYFAHTKSYTFGLWREDLRRSILWQALKPGKRLSIAPSWSWASTTSQIHFPLEPHTGSYTILENQNEPSSERELILEGKLLQVTSIESKPTPDSLWETGSMQAGTWTLDDLNVCWDVDVDLAQQYTLMLVTKSPSTPAGLILQALPDTDSKSQEGHGLRRFSRVAVCRFGEVVRRQMETWSGDEDFDSAPEKETLERLRVLKTGMGFWEEWKGRSCVERFVLV